MCTRSAFLQEYCECGGRVYRCLYRYKTPQDDNNGGQIFHTEVKDCCTKPDCKRVIRKSDESHAPCQSLDYAFDQWEEGEITRPEFNTLVDDCFKRQGLRSNVG